MKTAALWGALSVWVIALAAGFYILTAYSLTPGENTRIPAGWPESTSLSRTTGLPTLLLFLHPRCGCSSATLGELARVMTRAIGKVDTKVMFSAPVDGRQWEETKLWKKARAIPGVEVLSDRGGAEADRFSAVTSGTALLYSEEGYLLFSGGITASRGHSGDNVGRSSVTAILAGEQPVRRTTPVFGCHIREPFQQL